MRNLLLYLFCIIFFLSFSQINAQESKTDSLLHVVNSNASDSIKCNAYYELLYILMYENPQNALSYAYDYLELAKGYNVGEEVSALNQMGIIYYNLGLPNKTIESFSAALSLLEENKDDLKIASLLNNLALMYGELGQIDRELDYYQRSLKKRIELKIDSSRLSSIFNNIGVAYLNKSELDSANKYIGMGYKIDLQNGDSSELVFSTASMAEYFQKTGEYDSAKMYFNRVESIAKSIEGFSNVQCENYILKGKLYLQINQADSAFINFKLADELANKQGLSGSKLDILKGMSNALQMLNRNKEAIEYLNEYLVLYDSTFNAETKKQLESAEIQQKEQEILLLTQQSEIDSLNLQYGRNALYFVIGLCVLVVIIAVIYYQKNDFKQMVLKVVSEQRNEIAAKNQHIVDSITYARGIQEAIFPNPEELKTVFPHSFVYYQPVDLVSGDFFWFSKIDDEIIIAVIDCTGHGVPGAIMTVMANSLLNQIVNEKGIVSPAEILKELHHSIINTWHNNDVSALQSNGLDAVVARVSLIDKKLSFSGAKRPLYILRNKVVHDYKGNSFSIGFPYYDTEIKFSEHEINLKTNDMLYLFTDGLPDQFGGADNKKFLGKRLKQLLIDIESLDVSEKSAAVRGKLEKWMGENDQTDDMLLLGLKIK